MPIQPRGTPVRQHSQRPQGADYLPTKKWQVEQIAYEATATYHRALEAALADWPCVKLNPERVRRFAQATGVLAKTDHIDTMLLAPMAATLRPPIRSARSAQQAQLAELINARDRLVRDRTDAPTSAARSLCPH